MSDKTYTYLDRVNVPADFRDFTLADLRLLANDVREYLIEVVSKTGGHLGAGLGAVELTVALHYVFNTPYDKLVWDVGHQAYPHKILTGRKDRFATIRQRNGLSGFLKRSESEYDTFGAGHASTAISAALGMVAARDRNNEKYKVVAIVGDGSMTGGMVYEGMNNAGLLKKNMIVILNDNNMSIAGNVWAISNYFTGLIANPGYNRVKKNIYELAGRLDSIGDRIRKAAARLEEGIKVIVTPGILFEALGFRYFGPINGHNIQHLVQIFQEVKDYGGPILIHVSTQKGKGYAPAEQDAQNFHGVTPFDKDTGVALKKSSGPPSYTRIFGEALTELAANDPTIVGITAAMPDGTGLDSLQRSMPERFYDVGIAEQHGVTFAAGLATQGCTPVVAIYSTFLQRAFDQIIHDVALQHLHVVFALDRGGLVGADGPTHHGAFDLSYLRMIPGMTVMAPKDENELRDMLFTATKHKDGPIALRYPRGNCLGLPRKEGFDLIPIGKGETLRKGADIALLAVGIMVDVASKAATLLEGEGISCEVVNMRFVKPIDTELLDEVTSRIAHVVTLEDNSIVGGFGSAILEYLAGKEPGVSVMAHGIPDRFIGHGTPAELYAELRLDPAGVAAVIRDFLHGDIRPVSPSSSSHSSLVP
ncbi:MAG TPA: 1-deoxy-D-xylulose-5-phosphate synthase [Bacteroidota bacterium]|nr:1-deoxy-D-xylulose-5-phosphate synthase [Bacteroidota bacterium]